ncbi:hypothetical protein LTR37_019495 [Vermiconidia calcicola]|uniref:Uncharacterized protein n=1 Tax=Vermiconidia calcicola TaxID=1690605 RepID=A0ACC3MDW1_9PEZI|nr:hypothetical protein LTR37_019495 [Vermiconidia calcicola]
MHQAAFAYLMLLSTVSASLAKRQRDPNQYVSSICMPVNGTGDADYSAPCNVVQALQYQCIYGVPLDESTNSRARPQANSTQRLCACQSQMFDMLHGCLACYEEHGMPGGLGVSDDVISTASSEYCAASATPSLGLAEYLFQFASDPEVSSLASSVRAAASTSFTDPIGNQTAVSLYYTPQVTGSAALDVPDLTRGATATTTNVVDGQVVATASETSGGSTGSAAGSASPSAAGEGGAGRLKVAVGGVIGLAGIVAVL